MAGLRQRKDETEEQFAARKAEESAKRERSAAQDVAPKREPKQPVDYRARIAGLLLMPNELLAAFPPTEDLALTQDEFDRALQVGNLAAQQRPAFRKFLKRAEGAELTLAIVAFAVSYALPRLDARGMLPPWLKAGLRRTAERAEQMGMTQEGIPVYQNGASPQGAPYGGPPYVPPVYATPEGTEE